MSELRATIEKCPNVFEVHFDTHGQHYFNVHEYQGAKFGRFVNGIPILDSRITETKTREEVLGISRNFDTTDKNEYIKKEGGRHRK